MPGGGTSGTIGELSVTENGTYLPSDSGYDAYNPVSVAVQPDTESLTITSNGTYTSDKDGYSSVSVNVDTSLTTSTLTVTSNGTYTASDGSAYDPVILTDFYKQMYDWEINGGVEVDTGVSGKSSDDALCTDSTTANEYLSLLGNTVGTTNIYSSAAGVILTVRVRYPETNSDRYWIYLGMYANGSWANDSNIIEFVGNDYTCTGYGYSNCTIHVSEMYVKAVVVYGGYGWYWQIIGYFTINGTGRENGQTPKNFNNVAYTRSISMDYKSGMTESEATAAVTAFNNSWANNAVYVWTE